MEKRYLQTTETAGRIRKKVVGAQAEIDRTHKEVFKTVAKLRRKLHIRRVWKPDVKPFDRNYIVAPCYYCSNTQVGLDIRDIEKKFKDTEFLQPFVVCDSSKSWLGFLFEPKWKWLLICSCGHCKPILEKHPITVYQKFKDNWTLTEEKELEYQRLTGFKPDESE